MDNGKKICSQLKEIRNEIARENNIPLDSKECTYEGPCNGTCPHCDAELKYLENELSRRSSLGKAAIVAGMTVGMVAGAQNLCAQNDHDIEMLEGDVVAVRHFDTATARGFVISMDDGSRLSDAEVTFMLKGDTAATAITQTDSNGMFTAQLPFGEYMVLVYHFGYFPKTEEVTIDRPTVNITPITLPREEERLMGIVPYFPEEQPKEEEQQPAE